MPERRPRLTRKALKYRKENLRWKLDPVTARLDGGGRSLERTRLPLKFPVTREKTGKTLKSDHLELNMRGFAE